MPKGRIVRYDGPASGWGALGGLARVIVQQGAPVATTIELLRHNKARGYMCISCAWPRPAVPHPLELCENGVKATAWELTRSRATPDVLAKHAVAELRGWTDLDLERLGRLTEPLRYDAASDRYLPVSWDDALADIGRELAALRAEDPRAAVFYTSGRASLEASYMYGLFARLYGNNNLPDSSNMCHETTSVALKDAIGSPVGTITLDDFEKTDCILFFGQNVATNSPRLLHPLQAAVKRGVPILTFNPLIEPGLVKFLDPQSPRRMLTGDSIPISRQYHQVRAGGDVAALVGLCRHVLDADDAAIAAGAPGILDRAFLDAHTIGLEPLVAHVRSVPWDAIEAASGLTRDALKSAADVYMRAERVIAVYGMGLTQHRHGVDNVHMLVNLLLLRGNLGREGAGICPVRGHSNVQGQRTVGISEKPELVPLDRLAAQYGFEPPREKGLATVDACVGVLAGTVRAFVGLGGNFLRAIPETARMEEAWARLRLTVHVATKLNRTHLVPGAVSYVLPCLGRTERDAQASGDQAVSVEDSSSFVQGSLGRRRPAHPGLRSEPAIVAGIARATLPDNPLVPWDAWVADYATIRDAIEATWPEAFAGFNRRMFTPGGFYRRNKARERIWETPAGRAVLHVPTVLDAAGFADTPDRFRLVTLRSNDQFNTTIYGLDDRYRGVHGTRMVVFLSPADRERLGLAAGDVVSLVSDADDGVARRVDGLRVVDYALPTGTIAAYFPECNPLVPLAHHALGSKVPAAKSVPVRIVSI